MTLTLIVEHKAQVKRSGNLVTFGAQFTPGIFSLIFDLLKMNCDGDNLDYIPFTKSSKTIKGNADKCQEL